MRTQKCISFGSAFISDLCFIFRYKGELEKPDRQIDENTDMCMRCGQMWSGNRHAKHDKVCFMRSEIPYNPRPEGSNFDHPLQPVGRSVKFSLNGMQWKGTFVEKCEEPAHYVIVHSEDVPGSQEDVFEGDWRDLIKTPPAWL